MTRFLICLSLIVSPVTFARAGSVDASYYSTMANLPVVVQREPPPNAPLPPFKVFIVRQGDCPPGEVERYVTGSAQLGAAPSRSCLSPRG